MTKRSVTKKPKLTKWFDGSVKPVRDGVYQREYINGIQYCLFKDQKWNAGAWEKAQALHVYFESEDQELPWRGLAVKP